MNTKNGEGNGSASDDSAPENGRDDTRRITRGRSPFRTYIRSADGAAREKGITDIQARAADTGQVCRLQTRHIGPPFGPRLPHRKRQPVCGKIPAVSEKTNAAFHRGCTDDGIAPSDGMLQRVPCCFTAAGYVPEKEPRLSRPVFPLYSRN